MLGTVFRPAAGLDVAPVGGDEAGAHEDESCALEGPAPQRVHVLVHHLGAPRSGVDNSEHGLINLFGQAERRPGEGPDTERAAAKK